MGRKAENGHKKFFYLKTIDPLLLPCLPLLDLLVLWQTLREKTFLTESSMRKVGPIQSTSKMLFVHETINELHRKLYLESKYPNTYNLLKNTAYDFTVK